MKYFLMLLFCLPGFLSKAQYITIDNQSTQPDSSLQLFTNYLTGKGGIISTHPTALTVQDYYLGMNRLQLDFVGYQMGNSIFSEFRSSVYFTVSDSTSGKFYRGLVLEGQVFVNRIDYFNFLYPDDIRKTPGDFFQKVLAAHYPKCRLDANNFVVDDEGKYIGEIRLEYKTLERQGCIVTDNYSIIGPDDYTVLGKSAGIEAVIVFYQGASEEFNRKGYYTGDQFEMYDLSNELVHKGVISRYIESFYDIDQEGK